jgi:hypothetical protein
MIHHGLAVYCNPNTNVDSLQYIDILASIAPPNRAPAMYVH